MFYNRIGYAVTLLLASIQSSDFASASHEVTETENLFEIIGNFQLPRLDGIKWRADSPDYPSGTIAGALSQGIQFVEPWAVPADDGIEWTKEMIGDLFNRATKDAPDTIPTMIANEGYGVETHHVTTADGYILEMHRIPATHRNPDGSPNQVVFLMHGILSSSADWVIMGPGKSLGYILADAGYDVWMGNARGNTWSKNHTTITSNRRFWNFSWHEIGIYDLPAMIDYALKETRQKQVIYIGYSQGTTVFYVMASQRTEYNRKIKAMFSLSPIAYMGNLFSPVPRLAALGTNTLETMLNLVGTYKFSPSRSLVSSAASIFCDDDALSQVLCTNVFFLVCGFNIAQLNTTVLPTIFEHIPAGASTRQFVHYGQEIRSNKFRQYDLGRIQNRIVYGSWSPPDYDMSLITAPVHLIYGDNDWLAAVKDVTQLYNELGNPVEMLRVLDGKWNHVDFIWGIDAKTLVYDNIIATIRKSYSD